MISAGADGTIRVWDLRAPVAQVAVLAAHDEPIFCLCAETEGHRLLSGVQLLCCGSRSIEQVGDLYRQYTKVLVCPLVPLRQW